MDTVCFLTNGLTDEQVAGIDVSTVRSLFLELFRVVGIANDAVTQLRGQWSASYNWGKVRIDEHPFSAQRGHFQVPV
jgi:hypothetical protein